MYHYGKAKDAETEASTKFWLVNDAYRELWTLKAIADSKNKKKFDYAKGSISKILDSAGADVVDMITDAAAFIFQKIEENAWDHLDPSQNKSAIETAIEAVTEKRRKRLDEWKTARQKKKEAEAAKDAAFDAWEEQKAVVYSFGPKDGNYTAYVGDSHTAQLTLSKRYSEITWYLNGTQTLWSSVGGDVKTDQKVIAENSFYIDSSGSHTISVKAKMKSTSEVVDASFTLNVIDANITFNKYMFNSGERLIVTVERPRLWEASMKIDEMGSTTSRALSDGTAILSSTVSVKDGTPGTWYKRTVTVTVRFVKKDGDTKRTTSTHESYIWVKKLYDSEDSEDSDESTIPQAPAWCSLRKTGNKGELRLRWKKSSDDGGSPITDYEYQVRHFDDDSNSWTSWPDDDSWESAGTSDDDSVYGSHVISGLKSKTAYNIRMRAKNKKGVSPVVYGSGAYNSNVTN